MQLKNYLLALITSLSLATAISDEEREANIQAGLRLIKTSESDPGTWVSDDDKQTEYVAKHRHFIDVTDITDEFELNRLSTSPEDASQVEVAAVTYPTTMSHQTEANAMIGRLNSSGPQSWLRSLTDFYNRFYRSSYGTQSATWMFNTVRSVASANSNIVVTQFTHSNFNQPSVIARIPGSSPNLIIVGAHYDSTGGSSSARGPGADDNGSGVVVILEALRVLAAASFRPQNTIEFHFYGGEEGGLLGSQQIFSNYRQNRRTVLAFVNQDMAGYSPSGRISVYNDYSDSSLVAYVRRVVNAYGGGSSTSDTCGYGCSDHASAYNNGFPASYVCDEPIDTSTPYIHTPQDTYDTVSFDTVMRHARFTTGFLVEASYIRG